MVNMEISIRPAYRTFFPVPFDYAPSDFSPFRVGIKVIVNGIPSLFSSTYTFTSVFSRIAIITGFATKPCFFTSRRDTKVFLAAKTANKSEFLGWLGRSAVFSAPVIV